MSDFGTPPTLDSEPDLGADQRVEEEEQAEPALDAEQLYWSQGPPRVRGLEAPAATPTEPEPDPYHGVTGDMISLVFAVYDRAEHIGEAVLTAADAVLIRALGGAPPEGRVTIVVRRGDEEHEPVDFPDREI